LSPDMRLLRAYWHAGQTGPAQAEIEGLTIGRDCRARAWPADAAAPRAIRRRLPRRMPAADINGV
jgi:hypothetical protein